MVDAQHGHVGPAPRAALGDLTKGLVIHPQEPDRTGRLAGRRFDDGTFLPETAEGKAVPASGLLDQGRVAQCLKDTR